MANVLPLEMLDTFDMVAKEVFENVIGNLLFSVWIFLAFLLKHIDKNLG